MIKIISIYPKGLKRYNFLIILIFYYFDYKFRINLYLSALRFPILKKRIIPTKKL